jgi:hypothetical protein
MDQTAQWCTGALEKRRSTQVGIIRDKIFWLDDDLGLHQFMRKALPEFWAELEPYHSRLKAGERLSLLELFAMFELFRQQMAFVWAAHSERQQPAFENLIREDWIAVREAQKQIYEKV